MEAGDGVVAPRRRPPRNAASQARESASSTSGPGVSRTASIECLVSPTARTLPPGGKESGAAVTDDT